METFKIISKEIIEKEVEITLPAYRTDGNNYFKVYSKENCLHVSSYTFSLSIKLAHTGLAYDSEATKDCSEAEFLEAYDEVRNKQENIALSNQ